MTQTTEETLRAALAAVLDPDLERPIGGLAMVSHVGLDGARAQVTLKLSPPESPVREPLEALVRTAATAVMPPHKTYARNRYKRVLTPDKSAAF